MKIQDIVVAGIVLLIVGAIALGVMYRADSTEPEALGNATRICTVTESVVAIGHQLSTRILTPGSRQWAIIQQPINATNTVSMSFTGAAVAGRGIELTPATTSSPVPQITFGFATGLPVSASTTAITNVGSTTVKVIECK